MGNTFEVQIEKMAYGGDAIGRLPDGKVVFVPYAIPGEVVQIRLVEEKPRHASAELVQVVQAAPVRVSPRCQHFSYCGGCHYQHISYHQQLQDKAAILKEQLERMGGFEAVPTVEIMPSLQPWYYRNNIQFHLTAKGKLGYHRAHSNQPFAIQECHLPETTLNDLWPLIDSEPVPGLGRISLRTGADGEMMIILESDNDQPVDFSVEDLPVSVVQVNGFGKIVLAGSDHITMEVLSRKFHVSANSFFQVNTQQAAEMVDYLLKYLTPKAEQTVVDAYCGVGLFSAFLAEKVKRLVGIEISPEACEDYTTNLDDFDNVELYEAQVEDVLNSVNFQADFMVLDPPRSGLGTKTVQGVLAQGARQLAYVSCDPATLARDAKQLSAGGYLLKNIAFFDVFPQTYNIESISLWEKK
jgi:23S rRNA (uracil1939-C5)-methyltransferase